MMQAHLGSQSHHEAATPRKPRAIEVLENPTSPVDLDNVQGDVFPTFPKKAEHFIFFTITNRSKFRAKLGAFIPHITTAAEVVKKLGALGSFRAANAKSPQRRLMPMEQIQVAFSRAGFPLIGIDGGVGEPQFDISQYDDAVSLGDRAVPAGDGSDPLKLEPADWEEVWKTKVHGVFTVATESEDRCRNVAENKIKSIFKDSIRIVNTVEGRVRAAEEGHEHFGYLDGISEPAIKDLAKPHRGQLACDAGTILMRRDNDKTADRPEWTTDGTIMVFRKLKQLVPEFNKFVKDHPVRRPGLDDAAGSALRGARMVGRWKSGAPIEITPEKDNTHITEDIDEINNFTYQPPAGQLASQQNCPFTAHIRKTAPRLGSLLNEDQTQKSLIIRAGIPYGEDVTPIEEETNNTIIDRGLLFVCYNATLSQGFQLIQKTWSNNSTFPFGINGPNVRNPEDIPGWDPIIGNNGATDGRGDKPDIFSRVRTTIGTDPDNLNAELTMTSDFVVAKGGEYFFVPSMLTLRRLASGEPLIGSRTPPKTAGAPTGGTAGPGGVAAGVPSASEE